MVVRVLLLNYLIFLYFFDFWISSGENGTNGVTGEVKCAGIGATLF